MSTRRAQALRARAATAGITAAGGSYRATSDARSRVRVAGSGSGDYHADQRSRRLLRELSQDLQRNAETYSIFLRGTAGLIGAPTPRPTSPDAAWNAQVAARWQQVARARSGGLDGRQLQAWDDLVTGWWIAWLRDGDVAVIPQADRTLTTVLADQIDCPLQPGNQHRRTIGGVTLDQRGRPLTYHVCPRGPSGAPQLDRAVPIAADELHLLAWRPDSSHTRGLPVMAAALDNAERIDALVEAEVISAEQASNLYGSVERSLAAGQVATAAPLLEGDNATGTGPRSTSTDAIDYISFPAGSYLDLPAGLSWKPITSARPNLDVPAFLRAILSHSCACVGIPYAVIYADFDGVNWSGNRGLISLTRDALHRLRRTWCEPCLDPLYPWWLAHEIRSGALTPPAGLSLGDLAAHAWDWPTRPEWPDPLKEEQRHDTALRLATDSLHRIVGPDWRHLVAERGLEQREQDARTIERIAAVRAQLVAAGLTDVDWREVVALSAGQTLATAPTLAAPTEPEA
jgi:capsid protein